MGRQRSATTFYDLRHLIEWFTTILLRFSSTSFAEQVLRVAKMRSNDILQRECYLPRKEVIHPQLPLRMPCYDLFLITDLTLVPAKAGLSGTTSSSELTGGVYKTRERIHRGVADPRLLAIPASWGRVAAPNPN